MTTSPRKYSTNQTGQALVEFAILLPFLLLLVFGSIEFGRYLYLKNSVTNAAREGARVAAVTTPKSDINSKVTDRVYNQPAMISFVNNGTISVVPILPVNNGDPVTVTVRIPFASVVPTLLPMFKNLTSIRATATMRYEY